MRTDEFITFIDPIHQQNDGQMVKKNIYCK